jgi:ABC-type glycerol-3-phosphate transport system substrate-binding protein
MPLNNTIADEENWAGDSTGRAEALQVIKLARPNVFLPANVFSIDGPLWDEFSLIIDGEKTAQQALDEAAPDMQSSLDRAWSTWDEI